MGVLSIPRPTLSLFFRLWRRHRNIIPAIAAPRTARPPIAPPTAAPMVKDFAGEEVGGAVGAPSAVAALKVGCITCTVESGPGAPMAPTGGAAVVPPVEAVMVTIWVWPWVVRALSDDPAVGAALATGVKVEMLVTVEPPMVTRGSIVVPGGGVVEVDVDVVETIIYVEVTPQSNSGRYPAAP